MRARRSQPASERDRGATLVEYALIVALVLVASITGIAAVTDSGEAQLSDSGDRAGHADDNAYYPGVVTATTSPPGPTTTVSATIAAQPSNLTASPPPSDDGSKWIANATVRVTTNASPFSPVSGMVVAGTWTYPSGPSEQQSCTTTASGSCTLQQTNINDNRPTATFTVNSITGPNYTWTPGPGDVTAVQVSCGVHC